MQRDSVVVPAVDSLQVLYDSDAMLHNSKSNQPSLVYVFVVLSLAAFLLLFTIWRNPDISYEIMATFRTKSTPQALRERLLKPEFVLTSLRNAEMIRRSLTPELLRISEQITARMHVNVIARENADFGQLTLVTAHPKAGIRLLDSMMQGHSDDRGDGTLFAVQPAAIARMQGGSVTTDGLLGLSLLSGIIGLCGVVLAKKTRLSSLLYTSQEVEEVTGIPVAAEFVDDGNFPAPEFTMSHRRLSRVAQRAAELTVVAVFLVMVYQLTTRDAFSTRFMQDPLAAYGEALTRLIG